MNLSAEYIPFLIPLIAAQFILAITAVVHILRHSSYRVGNRAIWLLVALLIGIFGPVAYFVFGRSEDQ